MSDKDIVERLLAETSRHEVLTPLGGLINEAADEIVRLRAANEYLVKLAGALSNGDGDFREVTKNLPRTHGDSVERR